MALPTGRSLNFTSRVVSVRLPYGLQARSFLTHFDRKGEWNKKMDEIKLFTSERFFEVWRYTVSHRQLLLRSNKNNSNSTRIEILFKNVIFMLIVPTLKNLTITLCEPSADAFPYWNIIGEGRNLYRLNADGFVGYVAAGSVSTGEDELEYDQPSGLLPGFGF